MHLSLAYYQTGLWSRFIILAFSHDLRLHWEFQLLTLSKIAFNFSIWFFYRTIFFSQHLRQQLRFPPVLETAKLQLCWQKHFMMFSSIVYSFSFCCKNNQRCSIYAKAYLLLSISYVCDVVLWVLKGCYIFVSKQLMANFRDPFEKCSKTVIGIVILVQLSCSMKV